MSSGAGLLAPKINLSFLEAEVHQQSTAVCCLPSNQASSLWIHCRHYSQLPSFPTSHHCHHLRRVSATRRWLMSCPRAVVSVGLGCNSTQGAKIQLGDVRTHRGGWDRAGQVCWVAATAPEDKGTNLKDLKGWSKIWPVGSPKPSWFCVCSNSSRDNVTYTEITSSFDFAQY